jgi:hypothetical protein
MLMDCGKETGTSTEEMMHMNEWDVENLFQIRRHFVYVHAQSFIKSLHMRLDAPLSVLA